MLTAPDETYAHERSRSRRVLGRAQRRDFVENFSDGEADGGYNRGRRRTGLRLTFRGGVPESLWGRAAAGAALIAILAFAWVAVVMARRMVLRDERFLLQSTSSVLTEGNHHASRAELLEVFGADIERNILRVSLNARKAELEEIPWVQHATVMRLLPNRVRVVVQERTPVAFAREGGRIGLVDAAGILLNMDSDQTQNGKYSFPVVTGIRAVDPVSVRAARMRIFEDFTREIDGTGENISAKLSEIDLSNPEDVKALIPDHGSDVLVHFGESGYLDRYKRYEAHVGEWRAQYPKLSSVDMRYERQVVLEMQPGTAVPVASSGPQQTGASVDATIRKFPAAASRPVSKASLGQDAKQTPSKSFEPSHAAVKAGHP